MRARALVWATCAKRPHPSRSEVARDTSPTTTSLTWSVPTAGRSRHEPPTASRRPQVSDLQNAGPVHAGRGDGTDHLRRVRTGLTGPGGTAGRAGHPYTLYTK